MTNRAHRTNIRYSDELEILGTYVVNTNVDTDRFSGSAARQIARDYASPGSIGCILAELGTTGRCDLVALLSDIRSTEQQLCYPGGNTIAARHSSNMDNLRLWAIQTAVEVFETGQCSTCGDNITDDREVCNDCDESIVW